MIFSIVKLLDCYVIKHHELNKNGMSSFTLCGHFYRKDAWNKQNKVETKHVNTKCEGRPGNKQGCPGEGKRQCGKRDDWQVRQTILAAVAMVFLPDFLVIAIVAWPGQLWWSHWWYFALAIWPWSVLIILATMVMVAMVVTSMAIWNSSHMSLIIACHRYVIFSYADSGMSNTLEVEEEEEV